MELFRVGETLLRSPQPLLPFLAPAFRSSRAIGAVSRHCGTQQPRAFSTSHARQLPSPDDRRSGSSSASDAISSLLGDALDLTRGTPAAPSTRTSRFKSNTAQATNPPSRIAGQYQPRPGSSVDDLVEAMRPSPSPSRRTTSVSNNSFLDIDSMLNPTSRNLTNNPPPLIPQSNPLLLKLGPSVGRTVNVDSARGMDVGRAFRTLDMQCARNSVKKDFMRQRFHERGGLKRKRLRSERWRKRFKENFKGTIGMVQRMRAQGW